MKNIGQAASLWSERLPAVFAAMLCALALAWSAPAQAQSADFPNGAWASGVITEVDTFNNMLLFTVTGTTDAGASGSTRFWIDTNATGGAIRGANILSAAAQGRSIVIFNYGGQTAYISRQNRSATDESQ